MCCRKIELAPPLPPKRKSANDNSLLALSIDRLVDGSTAAFKACYHFHSYLGAIRYIHV